TSLIAPIGAWLPDFTLPASSTTLSGPGPEPSSCMLQRMHLPSWGIPCGSGRPVGPASGGGAVSGERPITATSAWAFGQWYWYSYETAPAPWSELLVRYLSHSCGKAGTLREADSL